ncbi:MAG: D-alanyl-D-alanine carboxypeptidase/D-alanyl-D-alanine-endopeptidase [Saprospiraceae bacterium]
MKYFFFIFILTSFISNILNAQSNKQKRHCQNAINNFAKDPQLISSSISICLLNATNGKHVASFDKKRKLIPASTQKLISCATALMVLGDSFSYVTPFEFIGRFDKDSIFKGNILIRGVGDPSFGSGILNEANSINKIADQLTIALRNNGINKIIGKILVESDFIHNIAENPEWLYFDIGNYYGTGVYGFNVLENSAKISIEKKAQSNVIQITNVYPAELKDDLINRMYSTESISSKNNQFYVIASSICNELNVYGEILKSDSIKIDIKSCIPNPANLYPSILAEQLEIRGIDVISDSTILEPGYSTFNFSNSSPPMKILVSYTLKNSNNLYCESFIHTLGNRWLHNTDRTRTLDSLMNFWNTKLDQSISIKMVDGSGLSRKNRMSSEALSTMLQIIYSKYLPNYYNFLNDPAKSGSLSTFLSKEKNIEGKFFLKSGSMEGIKSYAGYLLYPNSKKIVLSIFVNNYDCSSSEINNKIANLLVDLHHSLKLK